MVSVCVGEFCVFSLLVVVVVVFAGLDFLPFTKDLPLGCMSGVSFVFFCVCACVLWLHVSFLFCFVCVSVFFVCLFAFCLWLVLFVFVFVVRRACWFWPLSLRTCRSLIFDFFFLCGEGGFSVSGVCFVCCCCRFCCLLELFRLFLFFPPFFLVCVSPD